MENQLLYYKNVDNTEALFTFFGVVISVVVYVG